jgi:spermidine synthase
MLLLVLLATSFSSLVYEVVWGRELSHIFGTSAFAITTVLTTFMAGLAFGSLFGGRIIEKVKSKYRFLAYTEIIIGVTCLLTLYALKLVKGPYFWIYETFGNGPLFMMVLFALSFIILIIPTFFIGVAFPTVVKLYFNETREMGRSVGKTYMFDTIGGAAGALLTGFVLVATLGFFTTSLLASMLNILCGILLLRLFWKEKFRQALPEKKRELKNDLVILVLFFLSGFAALLFEVIWTRHIALIYGSSMQSFAIVLASFLAGLGIGSAVASKYVDRIKHKIVLFAFIELLIGLIGMCLVVVFPALERWFLYLYFHTSSYNAFIALLFAVCFIIVLIPTIFMGATLPVISAVYASDKKAGGDVGKLYSVNSFGSIFGAFMAGFVIIPATGLAYASIFAGIIYIGIAIGFLYYFADEMPRRQTKNVMTLMTVMIVVGFILLLSFYQPNYLYKGVYYHGTRQSNENVIFESNIEQTTQLVFNANSAYGQVSVFRKWDGTNAWLKNNGKTDASLGDMLTQGLLSHIPLLLHEKPVTVLQIGMGGAFSVSSSLKYKEVEWVDAIEIDPLVVQACRTALAEFNDHALEDIRTNVIVADGRNYLFSTNSTYDVIVSEPPNIWVSGVSNLFTAEFYSIVKSHLNEGGLFSQWFPYYEMNEEDYKIALKTLGTVFPYLYEFDLSGDRIILASMKKIDVLNGIKKERLGEALVDADFTKMIANSEKKETFNTTDYNPYERNYKFFTSYYSKGPAAIKKYIEGTETINTDDMPVLEFSTMRNKYPRFRT